MIVYRLTKAANSALDGEGARRFGGRWNSPGRPMVYTAASPSLALLEIMVHLDLAPELLPSDYRLLSIEVPDGSQANIIDTAHLTLRDCRTLGDSFLETGERLVLKVRSVIVPQETNTLINPRHADAAHVRMVANEAFRIDVRLA